MSDPPTHPLQVAAGTDPYVRRHQLAAALPHASKQQVRTYCLATSSGRVWAGLGWAGLGSTA